jgi:hypothetical protein
MPSSWCDDLLDPALWKVSWGYMTLKLAPNARARLRLWFGHSLFATWASCLHSFTRRSRPSKILSTHVSGSLWKFALRDFSRLRSSAFFINLRSIIGALCIGTISQLDPWLGSGNAVFNAATHAIFMWLSFLICGPRFSFSWTGSSSSSTASRAMTWGQVEKNE